VTPDFVLDVMQRATWVSIECAGPLLALGVAVGLLMGLVQAATQISEPALTFVPKLAALGAGLFLFGSLLIERLTSLGTEMLSAIGTL
jgi:flagellar biosynthetic protein FliQ